MEDRSKPKDEGRRRGRSALLANRYVVAAVGVLAVLALALVTFGAVRASAYRAAEIPPGTLGRSARSEPATTSGEATGAPVTFRLKALSAKRITTPTVSPGPASQQAAASRTIPERMARLLPGSSQIVVVTGAQLGSNTGTLRVFNKEGARWIEVFSVPFRAGTNGLIDGTKRTEGSRTTPTGIWYMGDFVFGQHSDPPAGTRMPYRAIDSESWWSSERDSTYNTWVQSSSHIAGEHLKGVTIQYEFALSSGYNAPPNERVIGRGTAIFLHVFDPPDYHGGFSAGCVGIARENMIRVFEILDPARKPTFAIGTEAVGTPTSIYSY